MTTRVIIKHVMAQIKELTEQMNDAEYDLCLEQLSLEIEEERQKHYWQSDIDDSL